ncbi:MAG: phage portal protein [Pararhodobacter sp.]|nr:phage portal protein [Pararhodobacter sp.]
MFDFFRKAAAAEVPEGKASAVGPLMAGSGATTGKQAAIAEALRPRWTARDSVSLTRAGFLGNPMGFRVVRLISEAAAALPLVLQDAERRYDEHPLMALIRRPNPVQGKAEFLEAVYAQLLLSGNAYIEAVAPPEPAETATPAPAAPVELHVLRADRMSVVPGPDGWPAAWIYAVGGRKHRFEMGQGPAPVCHIRAYHPMDDHYGLSPLEAAATAIDVHNAACRWSKALLDNAARPSGAIVYRGAEGQAQMTAEQFERLQAEMEMHHQGARNAGRPMLLEGGLDWKPMGFSPSDMEFHKTKEAAAREIAIAFGVPPMLMGIPGDATYANYQEANRAFYRLTVLPLVAKVTAALGHWLAAHAGEAVALKPDLDQVPALAVERDQQWRRVSEAGFLSDAEKRMLLGLPRLTEEG